MIEGHGNNIYQYKTKIVADFSSNIVYQGISKDLAEFISQKINTINNYPEPDAGSLQEMIAIHHNILPNNILATNGSTEAFYLLGLLFYGKRSAIIIPSFAEYEDACKVHNHHIEYISNNELISVQNFKTDTVWLGNPNNPDGKVIPPETIKKWCINNPDVTFILDEAYSELCIKHVSAISLITKLDNLIITRSLTKSFAIPGIRIGYIGDTAPGQTAGARDGESC